MVTGGVLGVACSSGVASGLSVDFSGCFITTEVTGRDDSGTSCSGERCLFFVTIGADVTMSSSMVGSAEEGEVSSVDELDKVIAVVAL